MSNQQANNIKGRNIQIVLILLSVIIAVFLGRDMFTECIPEESALRIRGEKVNIDFEGCDSLSIVFGANLLWGKGRRYKFASDLADIDYFLYDDEGVLSVVYIKGNAAKLGRLSKKSYNELRTLRKDLEFKRELVAVVEKK